MCDNGVAPALQFEIGLSVCHLTPILVVRS